MSKATAITEIISHKSVRTTFAILREKVKRKHMGQLQHIWIAYDEKGNYIKDPQNKVEVKSEEEVHEKLLARNKKHLGQARGTPFARGSPAKKLNWDGTGDMGNDILSGNILNQQKFFKIVQLYFESLSANRMARSLTKVKADLSLEEYKRFWKKKKEETVTSPFGLHIGHFKAAVENEEVLDVHRIMLILPFQMALAPYT